DWAGRRAAGTVHSIPWVFKKPTQRGERLAALDPVRGKAHVVEQQRENAARPADVRHHAAHRLLGVNRWKAAALCKNAGDRLDHAIDCKRSMTVDVDVGPLGETDVRDETSPRQAAIRIDRAGALGFVHAPELDVVEPGDPDLGDRAGRSHYRGRHRAVE